MKREIIEIDKEKCNGCGECVPACPEGAIQIIDGKARLVNESFCDGLGACIGDCPKDAIQIEEREAEPYDEKAVVDRMIDQGKNVLKAHLEHLKEHGEKDLLKEAINHLKNQNEEIPLNLESKGREKRCSDQGHSHGGGCPSAQSKQWGESSRSNQQVHGSSSDSQKIPSELNQWPVQLELVSPNASFLNNSDLLIAADCVPFAYANFHQDLLKGNSVIMGCPKLDDPEHYVNKLAKIFENANINSITVAHMEVPCCFGLKKIVNQAMQKSGNQIPVEDITITIKGKKETKN